MNHNIKIQDLTKEDLADQHTFNAAASKAYNQGEIKHLLKNSPIEFLIEIIPYMIEENSVCIEDVPTAILEDYEIAMSFVEQDSSNMVSLPMHYRDDADFMREAVYHDGTLLKHANDKIKNNIDIVNAALKNTNQAFQYIADILKTKENCLIALTAPFPHRNHAKNWQFIPEPLCLDEKFVKEAGAICPYIYQYLNSSIKNKYDITQYFLSQYPANLQHVCEQYKNDMQLVEPILKKEPYLLKYAGDDLKNNPQFILPVIQALPSEIHNCGNGIKCNEQIAKYICNTSTYPPPIRFFDDTIKSNESIALMSVLRIPDSMKDICETLKDSFDFISTCIEQDNFNVSSLSHISTNLKNHKELMIKAYNKNNSSLEYIGKSLRYDNDFLSHIFKNLDDPYKSFNNLLYLSIRTGDECIILNLCNSGYDINNKSIFQMIIPNIKDTMLVDTLKNQPDKYAYLKSASIMKTLECSLIDTKNHHKKVKI